VRGVHTLSFAKEALDIKNSLGGCIKMSELKLPEKIVRGRFIKIEFPKRGVSCIAHLNDKHAPRTCEAVWQALPQGCQEGAEAFHAKYARNEVYTLVPRFIAEPLPLENQTITPETGDVMFFDLSPEAIGNPAFGYSKGTIPATGKGVIALGIFYDRNNLSRNADTGDEPGTVFAKIILGLEEMTAACQEVWRNSLGEKLVFSRYEVEG
jgi:hypothetical protein